MPQRVLLVLVFAALKAETHFILTEGRITLAEELQCPRAPILRHNAREVRLDGTSSA